MTKAQIAKIIAGGFVVYVLAVLAFWLWLKRHASTTHQEPL